MNGVKKIRIAHIAGGLTFGGVESVILNYFSHMDLSDYELTYITYDTPEENVKQKFERLGFMIYEVTKKRDNLFKSCLEVYRIFKNRRVNVVHSHMNAMCFVTSMTAAFAGIKVRIAHSHLAPHDACAAKFLNCIFKLLTRLSSTCYLACGTAASTYLFGKTNIERGRVTILRNTVDAGKFSFNPEAREETRRKLGIGKRLCVGHAGRFTHQKNHPFLLRVFAELHRQKPESVLLLAGSGPLTPEIMRLARELGLCGSVIFAGGECEMSPLYSAMDVFLLPSLYEGFPVVIAEATLSGLPVVASDRIDRDVLELGQVVLLPLESGCALWAERILGCAAHRRAAPAGFAAGVVPDAAMWAKKLDGLYRSYLRDP